MRPELLKPDVIITHEADLDGLTSGLLLRRLAKKLHNVDVKLQAWNYDALKRRPMGENIGWVCDLNFDPRMDKPGWLIVDHHDTPKVPEQAGFIHDLTKSAGALCYELCQEHGLGSPELDRLMHLNNVADLYLQDDPDFLLATDYANLVKSYGFWNLKKLIEEVISIKRRVEDPLGVAWSKANLEAISPTIGYVPTTVGNNNAIVHELLLDESLPYTVLITIFRKANGLVLASMRSRGNEALPIAQKLQGGGHPNACGATMPRSVKNVWEGIEYLKLTLNPPAKSSAPLNNLDTLFDGIDVK
jgi:oligoribonuclease NrnB/cAMP/cGMP phosphodiesterase (DHH superfamily)